MYSVDVDVSFGTRNHHLNPKRTFRGAPFPSTGLTCSADTDFRIELLRSFPQNHSHLTARFGQHCGNHGHRRPLPCLYVRFGDIVYIANEDEGEASDSAPEGFEGDLL